MRLRPGYLSKGLYAIIKTMKIKGVLIAALAAGVLIGLAGGYFAGDLRARRKFEPILEIAYPKPAEEIKRLDGIITEVGADYIMFEFDAIDDYLPHPDRSPRLKETRRARVGPETEIILTDYGRMDETGRPKESVLTINQVRPGYYVAVKSAENIRRAMEFPAAKIEITAESEAAGDLEGLFDGAGAGSSRLTDEDLEALFR